MIKIQENQLRKFYYEQQCNDFTESELKFYLKHH